MWYDNIVVVLALIILVTNAIVYVGTLVIVTRMYCDSCGAITKHDRYMAGLYEVFKCKECGAAQEYKVR